MADQPPPRSYRLTRPDGVGFFRHWSARQAGVGFCGLFLAILALRVHVPVGMRVAMIVIGATTLALGLGRAPGGERLLDLAPALARFLGGAMSGGRRFVAPISLVGLPVNAAMPPLFGGLLLHELDPFAVLGRPVASVGLIEDRSDGTVSVVMRVHGLGFAVAESEEKDLRLVLWGRALADFCRERHPVCRIAWSRWSAPAGIEEHRAWLAEATRPDADEQMLAAYEQVLERVGRAANRSEGLVSLSISRSRVRLLPHHGGDRLLAAAEKVLEEADLLARQLRRAELYCSGPLAAGQLARAVRERLDPSCIPYLAARARSLAERAGVVSLHNAYPLLTEERADHLQADASFHRAFRVAEWPRSAVRADWLRDFLGLAGVVSTMTVIYHPQSRRQSRWEVDAQASRTEGAIEEKVGKRHHVGANLRRASAAIEQIDDELEEGAGMEHFTGLVVVTTATAPELEYASERVRQAASNAGMELRELHYRHGAAVVAALPLGRGVREGGRA